MKYLILVFYCLFGTLSVQSQNFYAVPNNLLVQEVQFNLANIVQISFEDNNTTDSLTLQWRIADLSMPEGWDIDVCDYGACYEGIPTGTKTMVPAPDTALAYLKLVIQPGAVAGTAWLWFRVNDAKNPGDFQDVYFSLNTPGTVAATEPDVQSLQVWPVPADTRIVFKTGISTEAAIFNPSGQIMWQSARTNREEINITLWPSGIYILQAGGQLRKLLIQH